MELTVGQGENNFTMSRGSFVYNQTFFHKEVCRLIKKEEIPKGFILHFEDSKQVHRISVQEEDGKISADYMDEVPSDVNRFWLKIPTNPDEKIYGCGETYSKFNLKGEKVRIWVAEHQNVNRISKKVIKRATIGRIIGKQPKKTMKFSKYESYYAQPTFTSSDKYYVHVYTNAYSEFDFSKPDSITFYLQEAPHFVMESGKSFEEVSEKLSALLGRVDALPDWIYDGAILAVQEGCEAIDKKLKKAQDAGVRVCGIWSQDWSGCRRTGFGYQVMWNWEWDKELYVDLDKKIKEWDTKGVKFLGYINPFMAIEKRLYEYASKKGYCVKDKEGKDYLVTITTFPAAMIDFTNPEAYEWYKGLIKENMIGLGLGGWMADFGEYLPVDAVLYSGEDAAVIHNQWPAIWAKMNREAIRECGKEGEVFFFTRAGHTGTIASSTMMWTGDQHVDWSVDDGLISTVPATLSLAMSGYGVTHSDAGGYTTYGKLLSRSKELLMRWEEMNAFTPLLRTHEGNQPVNDVQFDDDLELLNQMAKCSQMHFALKSYLIDLVKDQTKKGTPVMRPLFYHYDEPLAYTEMTEYLLGRDMLVAPIYEEGTTSRQVYLPEDTWVHLFTKKEYKGGNYSIEAPMGCPPVFIKKDSARFEELMMVANP
ncbi:MAG: alpha-glucosidase [Lachnospiraceae bacterium]|nr:alpha-glucosidase [Lachnospiraceae bacterium]